MNLLAALDFGDQLPTRLREIAQEAFVPLLGILIATLGPSASTDANKHTHFTTGPLVDHSFVQGLWTRVEGASAIIVEN
jgi:hypothetical protein